MVTLKHLCGSGTAAPKPIASAPVHRWSEKDNPKIGFSVERIDICDYLKMRGGTKRFNSDRHRFGKNPAGFHILGECPSCRHPTSAVCATKFIETESQEDIDRRTAERKKLEIPTDAAPPGQVTQITLLRCACIADHPDAKGQLGCGSEWLLEVGFSAKDATPPVKFNIVPSCDLVRYWSSADDRSAEIPDFLTAAQSAATKWQTALTAILGLLAIGTILTGRDTISTFSVGNKLAVAVALIAALAGNACMLYFSNVASIGAPRAKSGFDPVPLEDADIAPLQDADKSARKLSIAFVAAAVSFAGALAAVGMYTYVPAAEHGLAYKIVYLDGTTKRTTACGSYHHGHGSVTVTPSDSAIPAVTTSDANVLETSAC